MTTRTITIDGVLTGVWASERLAVLLGSLGQRRAIHLRANRSSVAYTMCIIGPLNSADKIFAPYNYFRILKSGCKVEEHQHHTAERLERAIAIKMVVGWRIQLMLRLGREMPELPPELLFSDIELRVLATFARSRNLDPPAHLGKTVQLLARLGGWLGRTRDPPGAQLCGMATPNSRS